MPAVPAAPRPPELKKLTTNQQLALVASYFTSGGQLLNGWTPPVRRAAEDIKASGQQAMARAVDALHNSGWLSGAIESIVALTIGNGLQLDAQPDHHQLGWSLEDRNEWAALVERRWKTWSTTPLECDAAGRLTIAQMTSVAMKTWFAHGEYIATTEYVPRAGATTGTKINMVDPVALSRYETTKQADQGIITDAYGMPLQYIFTYRNPRTMAEKKKTVDARTATGRPQVCHVFDGGPTQRRGITPLAPALKVVKQYDQLADATLTTTLLQTIFAATIKSTMPSEEVFDALRTEDETEGTSPNLLSLYMSEAAAWYKNSSIDLGNHGRIAHLLPNEQLDFQGALTPNGMYEPFSKGLLREIARCLPCTFETFTGDYQGATYSSVRMATSEHWPIFLYRREHIASRLPQHAYETWLEEEIITGRIPFPGGHPAFVKHRTAATRSAWRGPARPTADDEKSVAAQVSRLRAGLSNFAHECAENGLDWEENLNQIARERTLAARLGLDLSGMPPPLPPPPGLSALTPDPDADERQQQRDIHDARARQSSPPEPARPARRAAPPPAR